MPATYVARTLEPVLRRAAREFPAVVVTGPRQSGKSTLLRHCFARSHGYVSLEPPDVQAAAAADPRGFLDLWPPPVIFDEAQQAPGLLPYIKERIDENRGRAGQYLLSGSQNLLLTEQVAESLAGRAAILRLLPMSRSELAEEAQRKPGFERLRPALDRSLTGAGFWSSVLRGGYPEIALDTQRDAGLWFSSYVQTYLERDVRRLRNVGDLTQFQAFLGMLAARSGQLLNLADLGRDLGIALNTVKAWIAVLEATHQIVVIRPYFANVGKRLVKTPKIYFTDPGIVCHLTGISEPAHAAAGPLTGALAETAVVAEILKHFAHRGREPRVWFWRTSTGDEVDLLVETQHGLVPIEIKATATPTAAMATAIRRLRDAVPRLAPRGFVIHTGDVTLPLGGNTLALPFGAL